MHLVLRLPKNGVRLDDLVEKHKDVIEKRGSVWMGIRTCSLGERIRSPLSSQIKRSIPTFIYLLQRSATSFDAYKGRLASSTNYIRPGMEEKMPSYYAEDPELLRDLKGWIEITSFSRAKENEILRLAMHTTGTQLVHVLRKSMLSFGTVYLENHDFPEERQSGVLSRWG